MHALFRLKLELPRRRGEVRVFIAEQLIRHLAREKHAHVGVLVYPFAHQVHAHACAYGRDVVGAQQIYHVLKRVKDLLLRHDDLGVLASYVFGHLAGVFQVDGVILHAHGEGAYRRFQLLLRNGAYERRVKPARQQKAELRVRHKALFNARDELIVYAAADLVDAVMAHRVHVRNVAEADEFTVLVIMSRREGHDARAEAHEVLRLACKNDLTLRIIAVVQRAYADGVARGDEAARAGVVYYHGKLRVQHRKHVRAVFPVHRQDYLAVGAAFKAVFAGELFPLLFKAVQLTVAHGIAPVQREGLHPVLAQIHYGQPVEAQIARMQLDDAAHVRPARQRLVKRGLEGRKRDTASDVTHDRTHDIFLLNIRKFSIRQGKCCARCATRLCSLSGFHQSLTH